MTLLRMPIFWATMLILLLTGLAEKGVAQNCRELKAIYVASESRCTATGSLKVTASGGSGTYNYKMAGPTTVDYTSSNVITGLQPGTYILTVKDISTGCTLDVTGIVVPGSYVEPRFGLTETDVTCTNGSDGAVAVTGLQNGLQPFVYKLVSPSPMGVGTTNSTGTFTGLTPGTYAVQMTDSCGGIQTRTISIQNYTWSITSSSVTLSSCQTYTGKIGLTDSKGNTNASGSTFTGWTYGVVRGPGDTSWYTTSTFTFNLADARSIYLVARDKCGQIQKVSWANTAIPSVGSSATISALGCTTFSAAITGQTNLTNPQYCLVDASGNAVSGQPCNTTGAFTGIPYGSYCIKITNSCYDTVMTRCFSQAKAAASVSATATISNYACTTFTATVASQQNLINPTFCLVDASGNAVSGQPCNSTGIFNNLPYGTYKVNVTDGCSTTVMPVTVNGAKRTRSIATSISTGTYGCSTFTAGLYNPVNFTNPSYCLLDSAGNTVTCNSTGTFPGLAYGKYCIKVTDACGDTSITRCITATKPSPTGGSPSYSKRGCSTYTLTITGQQYIFNGQYCLYDSAGNTLQCNTTGVFDNVPYGKVCYKATDGCSGTVLTNCVTQTAPVPSIGAAVVSNLLCSGFTATISSQSNLFSPRFCLYDQAGHQVDTCNSTGVFKIAVYGSYTIKTTDGCTGKVWTTPVSATKPVPSVNATVDISAQVCASFTATISGASNLSGATYTLKSSSGTTIATNTTGVFTSVAYGSYCIYIQSSCLDTTIAKCFTAAPIAINASATATPSCTMTTTDLAINVTAGTGPYQVKVYDTLNNLISTSASFSSSSTSLSGIPTLATAVRYKVVVTGACGKPDTILVTATPSVITHTYAITPQCPSSAKANGSDNLVVTATSNLSGLNVTITRQDGNAVSIGYSFHSGNSYTFSNLDAGTYVLTYTFTSCSAPINDTVVLPAYAFPSLSKSSAYQCDNNSFSVGAAVTGGIGPYTYEIIASNPSSPSIVTAAQSNPIFTINNNTQYNLIRLRAVDACGNAALNDVSVLPLANTIVSSTSNCINTATTLSTDALANATFSWYKKTSATDSVKLSSTTNTYAINPIKASDTGTYVVKTSVNAGCLTRLSYFHLDGVCPVALPAAVVLQGHQIVGGNQLGWKAATDGDITIFELQRKGSDGNFTAIAYVSANASSDGTYVYEDKTPAAGVNAYRLFVHHTSGNGDYSNVVQLRDDGALSLSVYPNPVDKILNISIKGDVSQRYQLILYNIVGQMIWTRQADCAAGTIVYQREASVPTGLYILKVLNTASGLYSTFKVRFD